jgi:hypothetical protein
MGGIAVGLIICGFSGMIIGIVFMIYSLINCKLNKRFRELERESRRIETYGEWMKKMKTLDPNSPEFEKALRQRLKEI